MSKYNNIRPKIFFYSVKKWQLFKTLIYNTFKMSTETKVINLQWAKSLCLKFV